MKLIDLDELRKCQRFGNIIGNRALPDFTKFDIPIDLKTQWINYNEAKNMLNKTLKKYDMELCEKGECGWTPNYENHNLFETGCGNEYGKQIELKFCPFCGNEIIKFVTPDTIWKRPCKIIVDEVTKIFGKDIVKNIYIGIRGCNDRSKLKSVEFLNDYETFLVNNINHRDDWFFLMMQG